MINIPKMKCDDFRVDNWNAGFNGNFFDILESQENVDYIMSYVVGWFPSSQLRMRPRPDDEEISIYLLDDTWCHFPKWYLDDRFFKKYNFEGI